MARAEIPLNLLYIIMRNAYSMGDERLGDESITIEGDSLDLLLRVVNSFKNQVMRNHLMKLLVIEEDKETSDGGDE